jgi:hypothetical protein
VVVPLQSVADSGDKQVVTVAVDLGSTIQAQEVAVEGVGLAIPYSYESISIYTFDEVAESDIADLLKTTKAPGIQCAGIGSFIYAQDEDVSEDTSTVTEDESGGIISYITSNWSVVLGILLAFSEILALIPGINQNGIFQTLVLLLKSKSTTSE